MNSIKIMLGDLFSAPVQNMGYVSYMQYINTAGKITPRSLMDIITVLLTKMEEQEKQLEQHDQNFKEIEAILAKLIDKKIDNKVDEQPQVESKESIYVSEVNPLMCVHCGKECATDFGLRSHQRIKHKM